MSVALLGGDPFGDDIVTEPRRIEEAVSGVNDGALDSLLGAFRRVALAPRPRLAQVGGALLVVSPQPGYGKSHLLGRYFHRLAGEATLLYLRPYQDPRSCWISILEKVVAELNSPERLGEKRGATALTQLDAFARRLAQGLGRAVEQSLASEAGLPTSESDSVEQQVDSPSVKGAEQEAVAQLLTALRTGANREQARALDGVLGGHGLMLRPSRRAWLKVLLSYAQSGADDDLRQLCLDWVAYRPLDPSEGSALGLRFAELPDTDMPYEARNERCFERLQDLLTLGAYYRPFVLAFDQTELYGATPALARSLGVVLSRLRREVPNHVAVVTANSHVWDSAVRPHFEVADAHAIEPRLLELHGMREAQAQALIRGRLAGAGVPETVQHSFCQQWVPTWYAEKVERSARDILRAARAQWAVEQGANSALPVQQDVPTMFADYQARLGSDAVLPFDSDVLQWAVQHILAPAMGAEVEPLPTSRGYLSLQARHAGVVRLFGFESGNHWKRWDAVLDEAAEHTARLETPGERVVVCYIRLPELKPLPQRIHARLLMLGTRVRLLELSQNEARALYAAHDFAADAQQDNHELPATEVLAGLRQVLLPVARRLWESSTDANPGGRAVASTEPASGLEGVTERVQAVVSQQRFVTLPGLREQLGTEFEGLGDAELIESVRGVVWIKVHHSDRHTVLQWLP